MPTSLVTGFPGFIGRRLCALLLDRDPKLRIAALVEPRMLDAARSAAAAIDGERIELIAGDIGEPRLGLADDEYERLRAGVERVFHLAAIYSLDVPLELAQRVNVEGTGNVLDFCRAAEALERLVYISTAYVAGDRTGVVYEHELALGQGFKNHYESTKFQAEVWVRELMDKVPTTILRPAIVVGDSRTGETQKFDGPYFILRAIAQAARARRSIPRFGRAEAPFNVVPVDFVVEAIAATASSDSALGETLHLVDPDPADLRRAGRDALARVRRGSRLRAGSRRGLSRPRCGSSPCATGSGAPRGSRSSTSTTRFASTRAGRSRCSPSTACARRASASTPGRWCRSSASTRTRTSSSLATRAASSSGPPRPR